MNHTKLNKTAFSKATLKVQGEEQLKVDDLRNENRELIC